MKAPQSLRRSLLALSLGLFGLAASQASAQTTMITSVPYTIDNSGHYALADNLNNNTIGIPAIKVNAPNVIIDLNGFYVAGPGNPAVSGVGNSVIVVGDVANVTIKNGIVAGAPYGIFYTATDPTTTSRNYVVDSVTVTRCYLGGVYFGTSTAPGSLVKNCSFSTIGNSTYGANTSPSAIYTFGGVRMEDNNIGDVTATGTGTSFGINGDSGDFMIGNTVANCAYGVRYGKYLNNLTYNVTTPFSNGTNASGNN